MQNSVCAKSRGNTRAAQSYHRLIIAHPVKLDRCGLRSLAETRDSSSFVVPREGDGDEVLCPSLQQVLGSCSGPGRWQEFLACALPP